LLADPSRARAEFRRRCEAEVQARLDAHAALASQAVAPYTAAVLDRPDRPDVYFARAEVLFNLADFPGALLDLEAVLETNPRDARAWFARGQIRLRLGEFARAADDLREAMRLSRVAFEPAVRAALGDVCALSGNLAEAVAEYGRSIELDRSDAAVFLKRANARLRLGAASQAAADFARAAELDGESAEAQVALAAACEAGGEPGRVQAAAEAAVSLDPALPDGHILLARLLLNHPDPLRRDIDRATAHARKAVGLTRGTDPEATAILARAIASSDSSAPHADLGGERP
jgi:tetratricopeptide (TPR) repeat protein